MLSMDDAIDCSDYRDSSDCRGSAGGTRGEDSMGRYGSAESGGPGGLDTRRGSWVLLGAIVLSSSWLLLRGLNNDYITLFDEADFNVVQNLITHCCTPRLHVGDVHTDFRDWTDNHVWLHKPPVPLLVNAGVASRWPRSPRALRMASLIFAEALVVLVFLVGIRFFDPMGGGSRRRRIRLQPLHVRSRCRAANSAVYRI